MATMAIKTPERGMNQRFAKASSTIFFLLSGGDYQYTLYVKGDVVRGMTAGGVERLEGVFLPTLPPRDVLQ